MKKFILLIFLSTCSIDAKKKQGGLPPFVISEDDWATYEGRWVTNENVIILELSLKSGADSYYQLTETFVSNKVAGGTPSKGKYTTYSGFGNNGLGIRLHGLSNYDKAYFRYDIAGNKQDEMFFITRGNEELIPCDADFNPITKDRRFTLHKRSRLFTVEGYITFEGDSAEFFERNTLERWRVTDLGEFDKLKAMYKRLAKEKYEGVYLKGLGYSLLDSISSNVLVIKETKNFGKDPG